jgi:CHAT domain-containing protein/Tfp pilus assembly protein PilF
MPSSLNLQRCPFKSLKTIGYLRRAILLILALTLTALVGNGAKEQQKQQISDTEKAVIQLLQQAQGLQAKNDFDGAIALVERALAIAESKLGESHISVAASLKLLGDLRYAKQDYEAAKELYVRAVAVTEKAVGPQNPSVADVLVYLTKVYLETKDLAHAQDSLQRILTIREATLGLEAPEVAQVLESLGIVYRAQGANKQAAVAFERSLSIKEKVFGPRNPSIAALLNNLAMLKQSEGDYSGAEKLFNRELGIRREALGPQSRDVAETLSSMANLYLGMGDYPKAESLWIEARSIFEKLGPETREVASVVHSLAGLYFKSGDYVKAERLYQEALTIRQKTLSADDPDVGKSLEALAELYLAKGDSIRAVDLYLRAANTYEKSLEKLGTGFAGTSARAFHLNTIAYWLALLGRDSDAEKCYQESILLFEKAFGPDSRAVATALNDLAYFHHNRGHIEIARSLYERAINIAEKALGPRHIALATILNNYGRLKIQTGDYDEAERALKRALSIQEQALGPNHLDVAQSFFELARLYLARGDIKTCLDYKRRDNDILEHNISLILTTGSEEQKHLYLKQLSADTDFTISIQTKAAPTDQVAAFMALTVLLERKGRALDAISDSMTTLRDHLTAENRFLLDRLVADRSRLAALSFMRSGQQLSDEETAEVTRLEDETGRLEADVSARSSELRVRLERASLSRVSEAIPDTAALVEIALYHPYDVKLQSLGLPHYVAYVLTHAGTIKSAELGDAATIHAAIARWRDALRDSTSRDHKQIARQLDERVMKPIRGLLGNIHHLLISPDGMLNLVPFEALVDEKNNYLIESYNFTYLTSGRDLLRLKETPPSKEDAVIIADPLFNLATDQSASQSHTHLALRSIDFRKVSYPPLPATAQEAEAIRAIMPGSRVLTGRQATETRLKQVRAPRILHVATHGFFLSDQKEPISNASRQLVKEVTSQSTLPFQNALLRSGIVLAGASQLDDGAGGDGILTALEVAGLDLWGTKLVVFSACDTGLGDVEDGEGVYGLRRALVIAGAASQVTSLWQVDDVATRDLMVNYYTRLQRGEGRGEALRNAQLNMLKSSDRSHPYYWASFIQLGDWRKLDLAEITTPVRR